MVMIGYIDIMRMLTCFYNYFLTLRSGHNVCAMGAGEGGGGWVGYLKKISKKFGTPKNGPQKIRNPQQN